MSTTKGNGKTYQWLLDHKDHRPSKIKHWTPEEDASLREAVALGLSFPQMAARVGRSVGAVTGRAYRLGLTSWRPPTRTNYSSIRRQS